MPTATFTVTGMSCEHCVNAVTAALRELPSVQEVAVDLEAGCATVTSATPLEREQVRTAVLDAGYGLDG